MLSSTDFEGSWTVLNFYQAEANLRMKLLSLCPNSEAKLRR